MWTYFFELQGERARAELERIAADLIHLGAGRSELLESTDQPGLFLLWCELAQPLEQLPPGPRVWRFVTADSATGD